MAVAITMPLQKDGIESCYISEWHKRVGDSVAIGDLLYSYETAKEALDEEAKAEGVLLEIFAEAGDDVPCGQNIAVIGQPGEDVEAFRPIEKVEEAEEAAEEAAVVTERHSCEAVAMRFDPEAQALAERRRADIYWITPSGMDGLVLPCDVQSAIDMGKMVTPAAQALLTRRIQGTGLGGRVRLSDVQEKTGMEDVGWHHRQMQAIEVNVTELLRMHAQYKKQRERFGTERVTINDIVIKAVLRLLSKPAYSALNAVGGIVPVRMQGIKLAMSVMTDRGVAMPCLELNASMTLREISRNTQHTIAFCRSGYIPTSEHQHAGFSIHNAGARGLIDFTPEIAYEQTSALGVCAIYEKAMTMDGCLRGIPHMRIQLAYWSGRMVSQALAMRFLMELKRDIECPMSLFV